MGGGFFCALVPPLRNPIARSSRKPVSNERLTGPPTNDTTKSARPRTRRPIGAQRKETVVNTIRKRMTFGTLLATIALMLIAATGCQSNAANPTLPLQKQYTQIALDDSQAQDVLALLPAEKTLHTAESVSVYDKHGWTRELVVAQFHPTDSRVLRKTYLQIRGRLAGIFIQEELGLDMVTALAPEILDKPYESQARRNIAIVRACRDLLLADTQPFTHDQDTLGIVGMGRSAFQEALIALDAQPRKAYHMETEDGFSFTHSVYGPCRLRLQESENQTFHLQLYAKTWVDPFNTW